MVAEAPMPVDVPCSSAVTRAMADKSSIMLLV